MLRTRLIPVLLLKNGLLVRSQGFKRHQIMGHPIPQVDRYQSWEIDELVVIDISETARTYEYLPLLKEISRRCFMPLSTGVGIRTLSDIHQRLNIGADKVIINSQAIMEPKFITEAVREFGSQAIVIEIDVKKHDDNRYEVFSHHGTRPTSLTPENWVIEIQERGAGEIFLKSIDRDGLGIGYDFELIQSVNHVVKVPLICCGGVGKETHFIEGLKKGKASALAAGNFFHFKELSYHWAKQILIKEDVMVRDSV